MLMSAALIVSLTACGAVTDTLAAASVILNSAAGILATPDPSVSILLMAASNDVTTASSLYTQWQAAAATDKPGLAGQLEALDQTITAKLDQVLSLVAVKDPTLVEEVTTAVGIANAAIGAIIAIVTINAATPAQAAKVVPSAFTDTPPKVQPSRNNLPSYSGQLDAKHVKAAWNTVAKKHGHLNSIVK